MAARDPERRRQNARIAANASWARTPIRSERIAPANRAREEAWERKADPDRVMGPEDRRKAAENLRTEHYLRMSRAGVEARRRNRAA